MSGQNQDDEHGPVDDFMVDMIDRGRFELLASGVGMVAAGVIGLAVMLGAACQS